MGTVLPPAAFRFECFHGARPSPEPFGVRGKDESSLYPSYVALSDKSGGFICGGSLIARNVVLTASHCLDGIKQATIGPLKLKKGYVSGGTTTTVAKMIGHPQYSKRTYINDVALLVLSKPLDGFKPAKLATSTPKLKTKITVVGHGATERAQSSSELLRASMTVRAGSYCSGTDPGAICLEAKKVKNGYMEVCSGDSGGPGYASGGVVSGVVSYGPDKKCGRNPWSVFADVSYFSGWIKKTMSKIDGKDSSPASDDDDYAEYDYDEEYDRSQGDYEYEEYEDEYE